MAIDVLSYVLGQKNGGVDPSGATALAGDILYPKKAVLADGQLTEGTIPSQAAQTIYPSTSDQTIAAGKYLSGVQTVKGVVVSNTLIPANVADGVTVTIGDADDPDRIMEVVGTHQGGGGDADLDDFVKGTLQALVTDATSLRDYAAYQNTGLTSVSAPEATSVGSNAFRGCSSLVTVNLPKAITLHDYAFSEIGSLTSVSIPLVNSIGNSCFTACRNITFPNNELLARTVSSYAMRRTATNTNGFAWRPNASGAGVGDYAFDESKIIEIDGGNVTSISQYAFSNAEWLADADFSNAVIGYLGQYAFRNAGKSRSDLTTALVLDFHSGIITNVQQYTFAGLVNTIITLPTTVTSLAGNAFNGIDGCIVYITRTASVPTLSATTVFASASNSFVALPYENLYTALQNANWNAISSMVVGFAPAGTFTAGDTLPTTDSGSHDIYWSTDPAGEGWVTECPVGSPVLYAHLGSKTGWWVDVDVTGATVSVVGSDSTVYPIVNGRATVPNGVTFSIEVAVPTGWTYNITFNGVAVTTFPITGLGGHDYVLEGMAWSPSAAGVDWATDTPEIIQITSLNGLTTQTYGTQVGATRQIGLDNGGTTATIRLVNADDTMYQLSDNSRTSGLCVEFVDCIATSGMNSTQSNIGGWNASQMRAIYIATLFDRIPAEWQKVIATVNVKAANNGVGTISVVDSADKLFLAAEKEIFGARAKSVAAEAAALTQWKWYQDHNTNADRIKKLLGSANDWWLRSATSDTNTSFCLVNTSGAIDSYYAGYYRGVSPAFVI